MGDQPDKRDGAGDGDAGPAAAASSGRDFIAENLRALFRNAEGEPLPPSLKALLERLAREEGE